MILTPDIEQCAFRSGEEYAWRRADALRAVDVLVREAAAVLGGDVWLVIGTTILADVPQTKGPPGIEQWSCDRCPGESWDEYVRRAAANARQAIQLIPDLKSAKLPEGAIVYYNLTWASEAEFSMLITGPV